MRWFTLGVITLAALAASRLAGAPQDPYAAHIAASNPRSPEEERKGFHLPPGFEIQLVAAEPFVRKPINMNFDDRGRLWVTQSVEYPFPADGPCAKPRDTVGILQIDFATGAATDVTTFTGGLDIPIGVLPVRGGALVYSIPNIYRYRDGGHDRAVGRDLLYGTVGYKDTHGMTGEFTWGFDGWVYACHGFSNTSEIRGRDGSRVAMQSGSTYRFRPDGSHVEPFTHGQVNPFGLTVDPLGNIYSCDCHSRPIYQLLRGAYYPSFGKPHDGLGYGPEVMTHDHGSTAIAGITYYAADHFPPAYRDTVFIGNVVTNRINHDRLERHGSTVRAILQPDFLASDDPWFRPVDIKLGPDGALYVADFYNRIIGHYEVPLTHPGRDHDHGRIWRIVYKGPGGKAVPRPPRSDWNQATVDELVQDLAHPNLVVRLKATNQLAERGGKEAVAAVSKIMVPTSHPFQRMHGLWVLERLGGLTDATLEAAANDPDAGVRVHAMRVLAERKALPELPHRLAVEGLRDTDPNVQRAAADALGTHPATAANVRPLLDLRRLIPAADTHLLHVVRMALREQLRPAGAFALLPAKLWTERDARDIADVAPGVPSAEAADYLLKHLEKYPEPPENQLRYVAHVARYAPQGSEAHLLKLCRQTSASGLKHQVALLKAIHQGGQARGAALSRDARAWGEELAEKLLASKRQADVVAGIELGGSLKLDATKRYFTRAVADPYAPEAQRAAAMAALMRVDAKAGIPLVAGVLRDAAAPVALREKAANLLAGTNQPAAQAELVQILTAAPERLAVAIAAGLSASPAGTQKLLDTISTGKASARLLKERVVELRLDKANLPGLKGRVAALTKDLPSPDKRYEELFNRRKAGFAAAPKSPELGAKVFEKHCAVCHVLANRGAKIGPQLDGIGTRGLDRLLEDVLDPNRNVDQAFRSTTLYLANGQIVSGLVLREEGEVIVLADSQGKEVRVPKKEVEERTQSQLSPMPANFADQIPESDFYHLMSYLLAQQERRDLPGGGSAQK